MGNRGSTGGRGNVVYGCLQEKKERMVAVTATVVGDGQRAIAGSGAVGDSQCLTCAGLVTWCGRKVSSLEVACRPHKDSLDSQMRDALGYHAATTWMKRPPPFVPGTTHQRSLDPGNNHPY